jgi:hypothetical protein
MLGHGIIECESKESKELINRTKVYKAKVPLELQYNRWISVGDTIAIELKSPINYVTNIIVSINK